MKYCPICKKEVISHFIYVPTVGLEGFARVCSECGCQLHDEFLERCADPEAAAMHANDAMGFLSGREILRIRRDQDMTEKEMLEYLNDALVYMGGKPLTMAQFKDFERDRAVHDQTVELLLGRLMVQAAKQRHENSPSAVDAYKSTMDKHHGIMDIKGFKSEINREWLGKRITVGSKTAIKFIDAAARHALFGSISPYGYTLDNIALRLERYGYGIEWDELDGELFLVLHRRW